EVAELPLVDFDSYDKSWRRGLLNICFQEKVVIIIRVTVLVPGKPSPVRDGAIVGLAPIHVSGEQQRAVRAGDPEQGRRPPTREVRIHHQRVARSSRRDMVLAKAPGARGGVAVRVAVWTLVLLVEGPAPFGIEEESVVIVTTSHEIVPTDGSAFERA